MVRKLNDSENLYLYQPLRYQPPEKFITLSELPNTHWASNVDVVNDPSLTRYPDSVNFTYATTVPRNPHYVQHTIQPFIREGVNSRDQRRKVYRFNRNQYFETDIPTVQKDSLFIMDNFSPSTDEFTRN